MLTQQILTYSLGIVALLNVAVVVWNSVRKPQEQGEKNDAVFTSELKNLANNFDTRFQDMKDGVVKVMQNDLQEVKKGMTDHMTNQGIYEREIAGKTGEIMAKLDFLINKK